VRYALIAFAAALMASPVQAQQAAADSAYEQAVAARLRGEPSEAIRLLEPLVAAEPANADARVQLGYAYLALGRLDDAAQAFEAALAIAPAYDDARLGLARVAQRRGDRAGAMRELAALDPANAEVRALRERIGADPMATRWSLDVDGSYAAVDGPQPDWKEASVQLRHRVTDRTALAARVEVARRFGLSDVYVEGLVDQAIGSRARAYVLIGATPDADFRPRWQAGAGGSLRIRDGAAATVLTFDLRHAEFATGDVQTVVPGVEQYLLGGKAWLTGRWINLFDDSGRHLSGYLVRGDVQATDDVRLFAGFSNAPDTSEGIVVDTRGYFGGASVALGERVTMRLSAAFEDSDTGADRTQLSLGLGWRF
jgi:YaiO family outer membrane protein